MIYEQMDLHLRLTKQKGKFFQTFSKLWLFTFDKRDRTFMPTSGEIIKFNQELPLYADKSFIANSLTASTYKSINEDVVCVQEKYIYPQ